MHHATIIGGGNARANTAFFVVEQGITGVARFAPQAKFLIATELVDLTTAEFSKRSGLARSQVIGIGGGGAERIVEVELTAADETALDRSAAAMRERVALLDSLYSPG